MKNMVYLLGILFLAIAVLLLSGKGSWLIAGYNTASAEEKKKYDVKKLNKGMGVMMLVIAAATLLLAYINTEQFAVIYGIILCISVIAGMIYTGFFCKAK